MNGYINLVMLLTDPCMTFTPDPDASRSITNTDQTTILCDSNFIDHTLRKNTTSASLGIYICVIVGVT